MHAKERERLLLFHNHCYENVSVADNLFVIMAVILIFTETKETSQVVIVEV
jgi:hypothetical protein